MDATPGIDLDDRVRARLLDHVFGAPDRSIDAVLLDAAGDVLGTYHGRPDGGIAPGDGDQAVIGGGGRFAYVVDARRGWEAVYERRDGVLAQLSGGPVARPARRRPAHTPARPPRRPAAALAVTALVAGVAAAAAFGVQRGPDRAVAASIPSAAAATPTVTLPPPTFAAAATTTRRHTIRRGETLSGIARDVYFTTRTIPGLAAANGIADPDAIRAGERLALPPATAVTGAGA